MSWPPALRHVTRLVGQNEAAAARIRRLIESQHKHEHEWHQARQRLIETQKTRKAAEDKVADVLSAVLTPKASSCANIGLGGLSEGWSDRRKATR